MKLRIEKEKELLKNAIRHPGPTELLWENISYEDDSYAEGGALEVAYLERLEEINKRLLSEIYEKLTTEGLELHEVPRYRTHLLALNYAVLFNVKDGAKEQPLADLLVSLHTLLFKLQLTVPE